eukprot:9102971-Lingulodinium_polyedra.AAC.1
MNWPETACNTVSTCRLPPAGEALGWRRSWNARRSRAVSCWISIECRSALRARASSNLRTNLDTAAHGRANA